MRASRFTISLCLAALLSSCGGGGSSGPPTSGAPTPTPTPSSTPTPTPTPTSTACSLSTQQAWVKSAVDEWYLFPDLVDNTVSPAAHSDLQGYLDALVAPARAQSKDRYFSYITSIAEEDALIQSGATAGFGFRLSYFNDNGTLRVFINESFEGTTALGANIDRGDELLGVATPGGAMLMINTLPATSASVNSVIDALGPGNPGTERVLRIGDLGGGTRDATIAKTNYNLSPVSSRYGSKVFNSAGTLVGYINLRTFISSTANAQLRTAFQSFKSQGVTRVIVDLRYNGGGLVNVAEVFGSLLKADKVGQVFSYTTLRPSKASENETTNFASESSAIAATKIAFIGTGNSASASELLMNAMPPYLASNVALIGTNTYGKPVGQFAFDLSACDTRLRLIAFKTENKDHQGEYYTGLASTMPKTCYAADDIYHALGDANETSIAAALNWLGGGTCTAISSASKTTQALRERRELMIPDRPNAAQRDVPGLF